MNGCYVLFHDHAVVAYATEIDALREAVETHATVRFVPFGMSFTSVLASEERYAPDEVDEPVPYIVREIPNPVVPQAGPVRPNVMGNAEERAAYIALLSQGANQMAPAEAGDAGSGAVTDHGVGIIEPS